MARDLTIDADGNAVERRISPADVYDGGLKFLTINHRQFLLLESYLQTPLPF
jgi:hypothetical protein